MPGSQPLWHGCSYHFVDGVQPGNSLFLYNYSTHEFLGPFVAASGVQWEFEPDAWGGRLPVQVRIQPTSSYRRIHRDHLQNIVPFTRTDTGEYPHTQISGEACTKLFAVFRQQHLQRPLPETTNTECDLHLPTSRLPRPDIYCTDGHIVRSRMEQIIDDWLFRNRICHGYERRVPVAECLFCDFWIPDCGKGNVYIEAWGMDNPVYTERREEKVAIYQKYGLTLIEIVDEDMRRIDEVLPERLRGWVSDGMLIG
ncbi:MAG: hypothetical protein N2691_02085 [Patescibacteria group bacterium]|nr:hypothetical protein [Patescibacteria group bacterium]